MLSIRNLIKIELFLYAFRKLRMKQKNRKMKFFKFNLKSKYIGWLKILP